MTWTDEARTRGEERTIQPRRWEEVMRDISDEDIGDIEEWRFFRLLLSRFNWFSFPFFYLSQKLHSDHSIHWLNKKSMKSMCSTIFG